MLEKFRSFGTKSKKNTVDPERIIKLYGADSARLFILSDSPPEKDVQWSDEGIASSYKFLQKLWFLNSLIIGEIKKKHKTDNNLNLKGICHKNCIFDDNDGKKNCSAMDDDGNC